MNASSPGFFRRLLGLSVLWSSQPTERRKGATGLPIDLERYLHGREALWAATGNPLYVWAAVAACSLWEDEQGSASGPHPLPPWCQDYLGKAGFKFMAEVAKLKARDRKPGAPLLETRAVVADVLDFTPSDRGSNVFNEYVKDAACIADAAWYDSAETEWPAAFRRAMLRRRHATPAHTTAPSKIASPGGAA
jgi:hypothetical protein